MGWFKNLVVYRHSRRQPIRATHNVNRAVKIVASCRMRRGRTDDYRQAAGAIARPSRQRLLTLTNPSPTMVRDTTAAWVRGALGCNAGGDVTADVQYRARGGRAAVVLCLSVAEVPH